MTRAEHLQWAKDRAKEYAVNGDTTNAWASLCSDLQKHDDLRNHPGMDLGMMMLMAGHLSTQQKMIEFIDGFN
jgi:hypothetical protein